MKMLRCTDIAQERLHLLHAPREDLVARSIEGHGLAVVAQQVAEGLKTPRQHGAHLLLLLFEVGGHLLTHTARNGTPLREVLPEEEVANKPDDG